MTFSGVAIFILATTRDKNFSGRLLQIMDTWGSFFPHLYFVFGTNVYDFNFLEEKCLLVSDRRNLIARDLQRPAQNTTSLYKCDSRFNYLFTGNCTGEYFGIGPTCRCQEAMRYFYTSPSLAHTSWFIFIDDDIYFRPYALREFLFPTYDRAKITNDSVNPAAIVAANTYRSFR
jgi:hypothetical protein